MLTTLAPGESKRFIPTRSQRNNFVLIAPNEPLSAEVSTSGSVRRFLVKRERPLFLNLKGAANVTCVALCRTEAPDFCTLSLVRHIDALLSDECVNPRKGALPSETLKAALWRTQKAHSIRAISDHGSWEQFLKRQALAFTVFSYTCRELKSRNLDDQISASQLRVVKRDLNRFDTSKCSFEAELLFCLAYSADTKRSNGMSPFELLRCCSAESEVLGQSCGSFSLMMRFLQKHNSMFTWTTDPSKKTVVSYVKKSFFSIFSEEKRHTQKICLQAR